MRKMDAVRHDVDLLSKKELEHANKEFPLFASDHEAYAVMLEELQESNTELELLKQEIDEYWYECKRNMLDKKIGVFQEVQRNYYCEKIKEKAISLACEAIQIAAMAQKTIDSAEKRKNDKENV